MTLISMSDRSALLEATKFGERGFVCFERLLRGRECLLEPIGFPARGPSRLSEVAQLLGDRRHLRIRLVQTCEGPLHTACRLGLGIPRRCEIESQTFAALDEIVEFGFRLFVGGLHLHE